jgi:hypothetical protein
MRRAAIPQNTLASPRFTKTPLWAARPRSIGRAVRAALGTQPEACAAACFLCEHSLNPMALEQEMPVQAVRDTGLHVTAHAGSWGGWRWKGAGRRRLSATAESKRS